MQSHTRQKKTLKKKGKGEGKKRGPLQLFALVKEKESAIPPSQNSRGKTTPKKKEKEGERKNSCRGFVSEGRGKRKKKSPISVIGKGKGEKTNSREKGGKSRRIA